MSIPKSFASDNNAGVHEDIMAALNDCNHGHVTGYGNDSYTNQAVKTFKKVFGESCEVFFVYGGTGANVVGLQAMLHSHQSVICAESAHINVDECGAPENFTGSKLIALPTTQGKLSISQIEPLLEARGFQHHAQPRVVSITQATEMGTLYSKEEVDDLGRFCKENDLYLHMMVPELPTLPRRCIWDWLNLHFRPAWISSRLAGRKTDSCSARLSSFLTGNYCRS